MNNSHNFAYLLELIDSDYKPNMNKPSSLQHKTELSLPLSANRGRKYANAVDEHNDNVSS